MSRFHARLGTLRQLEILLAVHRTGSVTGASKQLFLTQPTVSMQLKKLSDAVGAPLYDQVGRKLVFTQAGEEVVKSTREIMGCFEQLDMKLADLKGLKSGTLRLAVVTTAKYFIPHLLGDFLKHYPDIDVDFKVGNRQQIIDWMENGEDDFYVFSHPPKNRELDLQDFMPNPLVAIAPQDHPLAGLDQVPLQQFAEQPFLMREEGSGTRDAIEKQFEDLAIQPNVRMVIESNEAIKHAVMSGLGVSILSSHTLAFGGSSGLVQLDVEQLPIVTRWYLASLKGKKLSVVARTFMDYVAKNSSIDSLDELNT
ncbi:LysR family transcriptional regulator [Amphritea balenae]|uniref:LysR family transcriptional regulator n=1 Tax=Amphritea balenae TaxID=452629 RepID=A0A3P1SX24_9GAMM|nr:LysR family transcriptional regulator [Amphritea balenae]RRD01608.1 LysR family transcriptional regulator [Amphritea balenae]GGK55587.1 transcriptional regulator [Amphritea balenae]